ncbi:uncharacterized protein LOC118458889 [Anopheles albimanus]|uniref:Uncharacterized protein n=1 Tax=Anopheles albimanus TaxID=7167 RepID=A0A182FWK8_ANOAL|nr:uncharacterized protein LOC118457088 [Anopheles albimanus]XP_035777734.1 uncharacterized protein LOC118458889 [Anopheles albimanus]
MKALVALILAFGLVAAVCGSPFFHGHLKRRTYHPVAVPQYVHVPQVYSAPVYVRNVVHKVPVYVPVAAPPVVAPPAVTNVEAGGTVNVAANPGAVHVTKTAPIKVSV